MVLLRRRSWRLTLVSAIVTLLAYKIGVFWMRPAFMEKHYYAKQRLWSRFLASCDCDEETCPEAYNLSMMHGRLYDRLMEDSQGGNRSVVKHVVWQPHKVAAAYPWRLRMYAHLALVLPRSLAIMHTWLGGFEEFSLALRHLSQGVPMILDPESSAGTRVEPDASILCKLEPSDTEEGSEAEARSSGGQVPSEHAEPGNGTQAQETQTEQQQGAGVLEGSGGGRVNDGGSGAGEPGGNSSGGNAAAGGKAGSGSGRKRRRTKVPPIAGPREEASVRRFACELYDVRGAAALLRLLSPEELAAARVGRRKGEPLSASPAPPPLPLPSAQGNSDADAGSTSSSGDVGSGGVSSGDVSSGGEGVCSDPDGEGGMSGSCAAPAEWAEGSEGATADREPAAPPADSDSSTGGGDGSDAPGQKTDAFGDAGDGKPGGSSGERRAGGRKSAAAGGQDGMCRNLLFVRPPHLAEVSEYVRETEASPLALPPLELVRASLSRAAELAAWLLLPHVMLGQYVMLLAPSPAAAAGEGAGAGGGGKSYYHPLPVNSVGLQMMLLAGALLTVFELLLWARVVSELLSLSRPRRSWARRGEAARRVLYEGMVQPLREALLSWNVTHFVALPLLQLALSVTASELTMLLPLSYCVLTLGLANSDVAARATSPLLRVARRARHFEGGYHLLILNVVAAAEPQALPYAVRMMQWLGGFDAVGNAGRAAVMAAMLEEAPALAAALAAAALRHGGAAAAGGGELAAAMQAQVAAVADDHHRRGPIDGEPYNSEDDEEEEDDRRQGESVVLRWPAPLQLPPEVHDWEDVPRGFTCAITQQLMTQPAMLVSPELPAAPTYERSAIQQWLAGQMRDPKSNTPLRSYSLLPNEDLHRAIDDWVNHRLRTEKWPPRRSERTRRRPTGRHGPGAAEGGAVAAAPAGPFAGPPSAAAVAVVGAAVLGAADADDHAGGASLSNSGDESDSYTRSGSRSAGRSASVLASLAQGASSLMDTGVEVMSRAAAAAAATAATAVAAAAATAAGSLARREPPQPDSSGPSQAEPGDGTEPGCSRGSAPSATRR